MGEFDRVGLGVGGGEAAAFVAGAGDRAAEQGCGLVVEAGVADRLLSGFEMFSRDVGNDEVLPDGEAEFAGAEVVGDVGESAHLWRWQAADGNGDADVVEARLRLRMNADVCGAVDGAARFALGKRNADERKGEELFGLVEEAFDAPAVDEVFEACLLAIGAVAVPDEDANHCSGDSDGLVRAQEKAAVGSELTVAGNAAEQYAEVDACRNAAALGDANGDEADVVGVGDDGDGAAVVEGDVELAWEIEHVTRVGDVGLQGFGERSDVDKLVRIEACNWRGGDVADVVCAGAAGGQAERLNTIEDADDIAGLKLANLKIAASGEIGASRAAIFGQLCKSAKLMR